MIAMIVGRDVQNLDMEQITKASVETVAENTSDGTVAPLLFMALGGAPLGFFYKAINTMDSMIAYKTVRYFYFGKTAAMVDDIANYLPARLTAILIVLLAQDKRLARRCLWRDGHKLESPNAGFPIAAMAGAFGVALGGDAWYHGRLKHKPVLGLSINPVNKAVLVQALTMKTGFNLMVLGLLAAGAMLT